jgi:acetyl-CoA carboxylase biotin carboxyl carrier protein
LSLTAKDVDGILKALEASTFDTLELEIDGVKLSLRRGQGTAGASTAASRSHAGAGEAGAPAPVEASAVPATPPPVEVPPGTTPVTAPLLGIFYRAPKPGEPAYIETGARVAPDTIIGIIEVMKLMNTVRAGVHGEVVAIVARNGELVEFGEALLFVRPD